MENALRHLEWAHLCGAEKLKEAAGKYIAQERYQVWFFEEWKDFNRIYPDLFYQSATEWSTSDGTLG